MELSRLSLNGVPLTPSPSVRVSPAEAAESFSRYLSDAIQQVNEAQVQSARMTGLFAAGQVQDVHQVMIAGQKASVSLELALQVRNKVIEAYQEIMRMSV